MIVKFKLTPYHLVENSLHPALLSLSLYNLAISLISSLANISNPNIIISGLCVIIFIIVWLLDINLESNYYGYHTSKVKNGLYFGFLLFIISEIALFFSLFWAYFHNSLVPTIDIGGIWPPMGIEAIFPYDTAIYGSLILFSSSITLTAAHYLFIYHWNIGSILYLTLTVLLGLTFTGIQAFEYYHTPWTMNFSTYCSSFYILTGLHGIHVILGSLMLLISLVNVVKYNCRLESHLGYRLCILYWHFVDILWFVVYCVSYMLPHSISFLSILNLEEDLRFKIEIFTKDRNELQNQISIRLKKELEEKQVITKMKKDLNNFNSRINRNQKKLNAIYEKMHKDLNK